jgi:hypothetical protein
MMVLSMMRQVFSLNDAYLMLVEVGLGAATVQLFRRKHRVARFIVGIPFLLLTLLHGLELLAEILSYNIREVGFMNLMPYYPLPIVFGIFGTNSLVDFLIHRISSKEVSETPPWKKRVRGFVLGTLLLLLVFVGLTWAARQMLGPSILFRPYPRPEVPLQLIDSRSPVASLFFLAGLALIGLLAWMQGSRLQEQGLDTLKRIGFYLVVSWMFHYMLMMLVTSYTELDDIQAGSFISAYWFSGALLWFLLGWDVIFVYLPFSPQLRTPAPLFGQGQTCLYCQQKVRFEKGRIRGHDPRCPLLPDPAADGLMRRCMELMEQKKWDTAANMLRAATEAHPHYLKFFTYYGKALLELGEVDQALEVLSLSAGVDWTSNHDSILTEARIAKAKLDAGYREQLLAEAQAAVKVKGPPNFLAQRIIKELEHPQKAVEGKKG